MDLGEGMNNLSTTDVAEYIGTTPRVLRVFLRSPFSTFRAVGSSSRYEFRDAELPTLAKRFKEWESKGGRAKATTKKNKRPKPTNGTVVRKLTPETTREQRDQEVWAEEGPVVMEDIRDPRVRAKVRALAQDQELKLELQLLRAGLHITQMGDRRR